MESLLLMAASLIALGGAVFHGYVGGQDLHASRALQRSYAADTVSQFGFLADVYDVSVSQWRHVDLRRRET